MAITLKAARINAGYTQQEVAECVGVSVSTIKSWESGKTYPKQPQIECLCELFGLKYDQIFFGKRLA